MFRWVCIGVAAALLWSGSARAQEADQRLALAERYVELSLGENLNKVFSDMAEQIVAQYPDPNGPEAQWMRRNLPGFAQDIADGVAEATAPVYAERMTLEELTALVEFYDTPLGRRILNKSVELTIELQPAMDAIAIQEAQELFTKFCAEFDCDVAPNGAGPAKS